jgi:hypothetical protein
MTTTETTRDLLTLHLSNLDAEDLQGLVERLGAAHWMPNKLIWARQEADKLRQRADEIERTATQNLADEILEEWTPDEIETAK